MAHVVCQVTHKPGRMSILWSADAASFEPISLEGDALAAFEQAARRGRQLLADAGLGNSSAEAELANVGRELHDRFFGAGVGGEVAGWLRGLGAIDSLAIGTDSPGRVPFAIFEDGQQPGAWGRRFPLVVGRRVNPLMTFGQLETPTVLVAVDPATRNQLNEQTRAAFDALIAQEHAKLVDTKEQLLESLDENVPDVVWILAPLVRGAWSVGGDRLAPQELEDVIRHADGGNPLPVILSTGVGDASGTTSWECFLSAATGVLVGLVCLETPAAATPACDIGLSFLRAFLDEKLPIAKALQQVRLATGPLGLALAGYTPPRVRVLTPQDNPDVGVPSRPLPPEPYHPLRPLEREERALLFGRDDDIQQCALLLDQPNVAGVIIHGRAGVGKASLVRAGLLPFLEEENGGFAVLRDREAVGVKELDLPTIALRTGFDLAGGVCQGLVAFASRPYQYATPNGRAVSVDLPGILRRAVKTKSESIQELAAAAITPADAPAPASPAPASPAPASPAPAPTSDSATTAVELWDAVEESPALLVDLLDQLTRDLPFELLIAVEHLDDLVTSADAAAAATASELLASLARSPARVRVLATARTEFFGELQSLLGQDYSRAGWRDYFLEELSDDAVHEALTAPTSTEPLLYASEIPGAKYGFGFQPGVAAAAGTLAKDQRASGYSQIQVAQAIGELLYEKCRRLSIEAARPADVKDIGKSGVVAALVERQVSKLPITGPEKKALRNALPTLQVERHGIVTAKLAAVESLPLSEDAIEAAASNGPLLDIQNLLVKGRERNYITFPASSLTTYAAQQVGERAKNKLARSKSFDWLWLLIPLAILAVSLTYFIGQRTKARAIAQATQEARADVLKSEFKLARANNIAAYAGQLAQADIAIRQGNTLTARQHLVTQQPISRGEDARGFEWFMLWNKINGQDASLVGHKAPVRLLAIAPSGNTVASGDETGLIILWNLGSRDDPAIATLGGLRRPVRALAFSPDGKSLAASDESANVLVWTKLPEPAKTLAEVESSATISTGGAGVASLAFLSNEQIVAGDVEGKVCVLDVAGKKVIGSGKEHAGAVTAIATLPGGKAFVSASNEAVVHWDATGKKLSSVKVSFVDVASLEPANDGVLIGGTAQEAGRNRGALQSWDLKSSQLGRTTFGLNGDGILSMAILGKEAVVTGGKDQVVRVSDVASGKEIAQGLGHVSWVRSVVAGGDKIVTAGYDNTIKIWSAAKLLTPASVAAHKTVTGVAFDPSEKIVASSGYDGTIKFWNSASGVAIGEIKAAGPISCLAFSKQANPLRIAAGIGNEGQVWELDTDKDQIAAKPTLTLKQHTEPVTAIQFHSGDKEVVTASLDKSVLFWSFEDGKVGRSVEASAPITAMYLEGGKGNELLVTGESDGVMTAWNVGLGKAQYPKYALHGGPISNLALIQQEAIRGIASTGGDGWFKTCVFVPQLNRFAEERIYRGHDRPITGLVQGVGFFATGGLDGTVKFWDYTVTDVRFSYDIGQPVRAMALAKRRAILAVGDESGRVTLLRSVPRPKYGPAVELARPQQHAEEE